MLPLQQQQKSIEDCGFTAAQRPEEYQFIGPLTMLAHKSPMHSSNVTQEFSD
jgi:hypothetical protein